ncbi:PTPLA-domain-containing protein, partial [Ascobolus immersus RN42]
QYLVLYNTLNLLTWSGVLLLTLKSTYELLTTSPNPTNPTPAEKQHPYNTLGRFLKFTQTTIVLEALHVLLGLVRTSLITTVIQAYSRIWIVWGILDQFQGGRSSWAFVGIGLAWGITEVVRYSFYVTNLVNGKAPAAIQWLRYNTFFILYPIGASSEWWLMWRSLDEAKAFNEYYYYWMVVNMALYPFLFPNQYTHMISQRRKMMKAKKLE